MGVKNLRKGGQWCLLCCLFFASPAVGQSGFIVEDDPESEQYGLVKSPQIPDAILNQLELSSLSYDKWSKIFFIQTSGGSRPVLGDYSVSEDRIIFQSRFLPDPNVQYSITFSWSKLKETFGLNGIVESEDIQHVVNFLSRSTSTTEVVAFLPSSDSLPANVLRLYLYFSNSMGLQNPYNYLRIIDESGDELMDAFVEVPQGLWNADQTRLTVLLHPGRIKRGVGPNVKQGGVFEVGKTYTLIFLDGWKDSNGNPLKSYARSFQIKDSIRSKISDKKWSYDFTCEEKCHVVIKSDRPLDTEMAERMIKIKDDGGPLTYQLSGSPTNLKLELLDTIESDFVQLQIDPHLEDVCGNTFLNPFDYPTGERKTEGELITRKLFLK